MAPWFLLYPRCPKRALHFSLFSLLSLIKLNLASHPLASSYSRVTDSSIFCAQNIFCGSSVWGAVKYTIYRHQEKKRVRLDLMDDSHIS